ncbi:MAG: hypothetical protein GF308_07200 [Candidatus Heimdallarchaeota archaeon]|nr:hypothetical protein [Candidatus Heimdallarchaeota archaeon]
MFLQKGLDVGFKMKTETEQLKELIQELTTENWRMKIQILMEIESYGEKAKIAIPAILKLFKNKDKRLRKAAAYTLRDIGPPAKEAIPKLTKYLQEEQNEEVKTAIVWAIGEIGEEEAIPILIDILKNESDCDIRQRVVRCLGDIDCEDAVPTLIETIENDPEPSVRYSAAHALHWIEYEEYVETLLELLQTDDDSRVRSAIAWTLEETSPNELVINMLIKALQTEKDESVRYAIIRTLGKYRPIEAVPVLIEVSKNDPDFEVRRRAIRSLGEIKSNKAVSALIENYKEIPRKTIRAEIIKALKAIGGSALDELNEIHQEEAAHRELEFLENQLIALNYYREEKLKKIIKKYRKISLPFMAEFLRLDTEDLREWLNQFTSVDGFYFEEDAPFYIQENINFDNNTFIEYVFISNHLQKNTPKTENRIKIILKKFREYLGKRREKDIKALTSAF